MALYADHEGGNAAHVYWCEYPERDCICPAGEGVNHPHNLTERGGLRVGDEVSITSHIFGPWAATVEGFTAVECDVVVRWHGKRPTLDERSTVCRKQMTVALPTCPEGDCGECVSCAEAAAEDQSIRDERKADRG